jgi:hypothetical protein
MSFWLFLIWGKCALDEKAEVKEEDVTNKSTKLMWQFQFDNCTFHFCDNYCKNVT